MIETVNCSPDVSVEESEYRRLLGFPSNHALSERALELAAWARAWYRENGRPWVYLREVTLEFLPDTLRVGGMEFGSAKLRELLTRAGAQRAVLIVASAGRNCEEHAGELWDAAKPDEYFFLKMFAAAVVERIVATASGRICELADRDGLMAVPHYSPGYPGWDLSDQARLLEVIVQGANEPFPEVLEVLASGMLRPTKALLGVFGLAPRTAQGRAALLAAPCENCSLAPCRFRRAPYRHSPVAAPRAGDEVLPNYTVNPRALAKWARERVRLSPRADGTTVAVFRYEGTTCTNLGQTLLFDYSVTLGPAAEGYPILESECGPAVEDEGHRQMCAYLSDADGLMRSFDTERPLRGRPLADVFGWTRIAAPAGCHCDAASRAHKWGLAFESIHFALGAHAATRPARELNPTFP